MARDPVLLLAAADGRDTLAGRLRELRVQAASGRPLAGSLDGPDRVAIVAPADEMPLAIDAAIERLASFDGPRLALRQSGLRFSRGAVPGQIAFLFPGQGSEHPAMLRGLRARTPIVARWFDALDAAAADAGDPRPTRLLDAPDAGAPIDRERRRIDDRETSAQLGSIAALALHELVIALGVRADVHVGHSNGEHPAVIASGRVDGDRREICRGFVEIGRISKRLARPDRERLVALSLADRDRLLAMVDRAGVFLAMDNCPGQIVAGGDAAATDGLARDVIAAGGVAMTLPFSRAYHTPLFVDQAEAFGAYYRAWPIGRAAVPVWSCFSEAPLPDDPGECRRVMTGQWTSLVRFRTTVERLHEAGVRTFVEVGPDARLSAFVDDTLRGRPHLALSTSAIHRGEVEQILHLLADLFVAGVAIDPARLAAALPSAAPPADMRVNVHLRLIEDARERLARMSALVNAAAAQVDAPLAGQIVSSSGTRVEFARAFSRAADPFVDDHALGRRHASDPDGSYPLPVLPFTASLEIAAEAAGAFGGTVTEIREARAARWLALDRGRLDVTIAGLRAPDGVRVAVTAGGDDRAAFEATVRVDAPADPAGEIARDPDAVPPRHWTAARFYDDFAFHRGVFRGLERVTAVGPRGIEASIAIGQLPGVPRDRLVLDPAMLDCAGQLVAFWMLEHERRAPTFGIFPFAAHRVVRHGPPPAPGARVLARAFISSQPGVTSADVVFAGADGRPIVTIHGFMQRLVEFPEWFARRVFAGDPSALPAAPAASDLALLETSWGIWGRALAHLSFGSAALAAWYQTPPPARPAQLFDFVEAGWER